MSRHWIRSVMLEPFHPPARRPSEANCGAFREATPPAGGGLSPGHSRGTVRSVPGTQKLVVEAEQLSRRADDLSRQSELLVGSAVRAKVEAVDAYHLTVSS